MSSDVEEAPRIGRLDLQQPVFDAEASMNKFAISDFVRASIEEPNYSLSRLKPIV
jgi:hypothetical protein